MLVFCQKNLPYFWVKLFKKRSTVRFIEETRNEFWPGIVSQLQSTCFFVSTLLILPRLPAHISYTTCTETHKDAHTTSLGVRDGDRATREGRRKNKTLTFPSSSRETKYKDQSGMPFSAFQIPEEKETLLGTGLTVILLTPHDAGRACGSH